MRDAIVIMVALSCIGMMTGKLYGPVQEAWEAHFVANLVSGLAVDEESKVHVVGTYDAGYEDSIMEVIKYDRHGNQLWVSGAQGNSDWAYTTGLALDAAGNTYVSGRDGVGDGYYYGYIIFKVDGEGNSLWYWSDEFGSTYAVTHDVDVNGDHVALTGTVLDSIIVSYDIITIGYRQNPLIHREAVRME